MRRKDDVGVAALLLAGIYEAYAFWTRKAPTITAIVKRFPWLVRAGLLLVALVWALDHFEVST